MDAVLIAGDAIDLIRVGAASIAGVIKRGRSSSARPSSNLDRQLMKLTAQTVTDLLAAFRSSGPDPGRRIGRRAGGRDGRVAAGDGRRACQSRAPRPRRTSRGCRPPATAARRSSAELEALVDRDSDAYDLVMAAYKKPKATDEEKAARSAGIQAAMREAIAAPLDVMRACAAAAEQGVVIASLGNPSASSDVQVGFELLGAALRGAKLNVEINLGSVKDADYAAQIRSEVEELERAIGHETEQRGGVRAPAQGVV